ncbi:MAG: hypothetical protein ACPGOY_18950 [Rhodospirillaceae bacterium]
MATLLSIANAVCDEIQELRPGSVVGNNSETARRILRYANKSGERLMKAYPWQRLRSFASFTAANQPEQTGVLPANFDRFIPETFWDQTNRDLIAGPMAAVEYQSRASLDSSNFITRKYYYAGNSVFVLPAPSGGETYSFGYVSNQWCQSNSGTGQEEFLADTDVPLIDSELMIAAIALEWLIAEGQPTAPAMAAQYEQRYHTLTRNDRPTTPILMAGDLFGGGRRFQGAPMVEPGEAS